MLQYHRNSTWRSALGLMAINILFVDDNPDTLIYIDFMLRKRGYEVTTAAGGAEALKLARANPPDLLLVDVLMPQMDGYQLTEAVRRDSQLWHLPVILFSAATSAEHKARGFEAGADDYLTKPILSNELDDRLQAAIRLATERQTELVEAVPQSLPVARKGRVVGFWGCKGGVGVTTLVINTAAALAQDAPIILADMNLGLGSIVLHLGLNASTAAPSPWTIDQDELTAQIVQDALIPYSDQLCVLLMAEGERRLPTVPQVEAALQHLRPLADLILLDLGSGVAADKFPLLIRSDHVVLVSGADRVAFALTEHALEALADLKIARERISVTMIQRRDVTGALTPDMLEHTLRVKLDAVIPIAQEEALVAFERGLPVVSALPNSHLARSYARFAEKLQAVVAQSWS